MDIQRDDLIVGGTKRRGLDVLLNRTTSNKIFYPGTTMGHGALALAHACEDAGKQAHIFICGQAEDAMIKKIMKTNAVVNLNRPMPVSALYELAKSQSGESAVFPPGFDMPEFEEAMTTALKDLDLSSYNEIWTCSVTGTLTRALKKAFPDKLFRTVSVVKSGDGDFTAPEKYHQKAKNPPPYPSCPYTDAKVWQFATLHAGPRALIWNTAA